MSSNSLSNSDGSSDPFGSFNFLSAGGGSDVIGIEWDIGGGDGWLMKRKRSYESCGHTRFFFFFASSFF